MIPAEESKQGTPSGIIDTSAQAGTPGPVRATIRLDPRYGSYVELYKNLDTILWSVPAFSITAILAGIGFFGSDVASGKVRVPGIPVSAVISSVCFLLGLTSAASVFSIARLRQHHTMIGNCLREMEAGCEGVGYFEERSKTVLASYSAPHIFIVLFSTISLGFFVQALISNWHAFLLCASLVTAVSAYASRARTVLSRVSAGSVDGQ